MHPGVRVAERFQIERVAASGGMGTVYRALDTLSGQPVALKVLAPSAAGERARFVREVRVLAELHHPTIVRYIADGETPEHEPWLAMEWLDGETLSQRLARGRLTTEETLVVARRVAEALAAAHARDIIHRDVKPSNVLLVACDLASAKLIDFGVVRLGRRDSVRTRTGVLVGTVQYMSPEQARGRGKIDARSDVFALGCLMFRCLAGQPPFASDDYLGVLARLMIDEAPRLRTARAEVPDGVDDLVARMLAKDPAGRPADGAAVVAEIASLSATNVAAHGPRPTSAPSLPRATLTLAEQSLLSVVLARLPPEDEPSDPQGESQGEWARLARVLAPHGARIERVRDGTVLVTLVGRGSATDSAAAAARCALATRSIVGDVPIVLATGRAVVAGPATIGEVIDRAVRLMRAGDGAPESARVRGKIPIRIDDVTAGLLDPRFDVRGGREAGFELVGARESAESGRTLLGKHTPFVGRDRELSVLVGIFDECVSEPVARAALVTAPAGMGKSRLLQEFVHALARGGPAHTLLVGRGDPQRAGSPFGMIAPALRTSARILDGEPAEVKYAKLGERVARSVSPGDWRRVVEFLGELAGVPAPGDESVQLRTARRDAMLMADQTRRAWEDFLAAECSRQPVLVVLEDLHWGDAPSVQFIDAALRRLRERPFMVLALARPEVENAFPDLWREHTVQPVPLPALGRRAAERLVREVLGGDVTAPVVARVLERAAGNAFYLEELIRAVADGKGDELPGTVLAMVQARLATLDSEARLILRAASVFGDVFWEDAVRSLLEGSADLRSWLELLSEREIVVPRTEARFPGRLEYCFRHAIVREAAYSMLTEEDRPRAHALAGAWLEQVGERDAALLADHFERGGERARAAEWYVRAAEQALEANDLERVLSRAQSGEACGAGGETLGRLRLVQALAHQWRGHWAQTDACARGALALLPQGSRRWCVAAEEAVFALGKLGEYGPLDDFIESLLAVAPDEDARGAYAMALGRGSWFLVHATRFDKARIVLERIAVLERELVGTDVGAAAQLDAIRAGHALYAGDAETCLRLSQSAIQRFELAGDVRAVAMQLVFVGDSYKELGLYEQAEGPLREAISTATRTGLRVVAALGQLNLGVVLACKGAMDEAIGVERAAVNAFTLDADHRLQVAARSYLGVVLIMAGDLAQAERVAREATMIPSRSPSTRAFALGVLATALLRRGRASDALEPAREAMQIVEELGAAIEEGESLIRLADAEARRGTGDESGARRAIAAARDRVVGRARALHEPSTRKAYLERVPFNARVLECAREWLGE
jgi:tetratricopeptide (TPR) repeat protein